MEPFDYEKFNKRTKRITEMNTVVNVFDQAKHLVNSFQRKSNTYYLMGVKDTKYIPNKILEKLINHGFIPHTIDKMARGGRAIDIDLVNPLTGKPMTGSSSGTAINVLEDINDIGLGTDGGGSVLAPAMALNLYGIISPLFYRNESFTKTSTDGVSFVPSIGFIAKDISLIKEVTNILVSPEKQTAIDVLLPTNNTLYYEGKDVQIILEENLVLDEGITVSQEPYPNIYGDRQENINYLKDKLAQYDVVMSYEGPVDYHGFGDSVFGLFNQASRDNQAMSKKGLMRVANMVNASALVVPSNDFSSGYVLIAKGTAQGIACLFKIEQQLHNKLNNNLYRNYFSINS